MNTLRNFEAVFIVVLGMAVSASYLLRETEQASPAPSPPQSANIATPTKMAVVVITGQRMSTLDKLRSLELERRLAKLGGAAANRG